MEPDVNRDKELIDALGGTSKVARMLDLGVQRVHNWRSRGIPPAVKLRWPDLFLRQQQHQEHQREAA